MHLVLFRDIFTMHYFKNINKGRNIKKLALCNMNFLCPHFKSH